MPISGTPQTPIHAISRDLLRHFDIDEASDWPSVQVQYRRLVQQWHPDRYGGPDPDAATSRFVEINRAYRALRQHHQHYGHFALICSSPGAQPDNKATVSEPPSGLITPLRAACLAFALSVSVIVAMLFVMDSKLNADNRDRALYERLSTNS